MPDNNQSTTTPPTPRRITVNMLSERHDSHVEATARGFAGLHERVDGVRGELEEKFKVINHELDELRRAKRGTTSAHARVAVLESEFASLTARLDKIQGDTSDDPAVKNVYQQEFERINTRLDDLFGRATSEQAELRTELDSLKGVVAGHTVQIGMLEEGQQSLNGRVDGIDHRVTFLERFRDKVPLWTLAVAAVLGVIAGFVWDSIAFVQSYTLADGKVETVSFDAANSIWAAIAAGVAVFAFSLGLLLFFVKSKVQQPNEQREVPPIPSAPVTQAPAAPVVHHTSATAEDTAPTKVLETSGADRGAH